MTALQIISQRVHSEIYVAEWKRFKNPERFNMLIAERNRSSLLEEVTDSAIEDGVVQRVRRKSLSTQEGANHNVRIVVSADAIAQFYKKSIIELTKEVQVRYFLRRTGIG